MVKQYPKYQVPTIDSFVEMHKDICIQLTEQEQRVVAKATINMVLDWNENPSKALAYVKALNEIQRNAFKRFLGVARDLNRVDCFGYQCATRLGLAD